MRVVLRAIVAALALWGAAVPAAERRVLEVGPTRALGVPSAAAAIARDGDLVRIDAGEYRDCAIWRADDLVLEGAGGMALVRDVVCADQAIWLISGDRAVVRRMGFAGATTRFGNGAGIKFTGRTLAIEGSEFRGNENGLLVRGNRQSDIRISSSLFEENGRCLHACAHGLYVGTVRRLVVAGSTFRRQSVGHHIKSRALYSEIVRNLIADGVAGTASYAIDLPNAGTAFILENRVEKGPMSDNSSTAVAIGAEGATNPGHGIYIARNSFRNDNHRLESFVRSFAPEVRVEISNNRFAGMAAPPLRVEPAEAGN